MRTEPTVPWEPTPPAVREDIDKPTPRVTGRLPLRKGSQRLEWKIQQACGRISQSGGHGASLDRGAAHGLFASGPADYSPIVSLPAGRATGDGLPVR
jgi:hypothetical protein